MTPVAPSARGPPALRESRRATCPPTGHPPAGRSPQGVIDVVVVAGPAAGNPRRAARLETNHRHHLTVRGTRTTSPSSPLIARHSAPSAAPAAPRRAGATRRRPASAAVPTTAKAATFERGRNSLEREIPRDTDKDSRIARRSRFEL